MPELTPVEILAAVESGEDPNGFGRVTCEGIKYGGCAKAIFYRDGPICEDCVAAGYTPEGAKKHVGVKSGSPTGGVQEATIDSTSPSVSEATS